VATVQVSAELELLATLTSPPMRGAHVRELQLMLRHNPFGTFEPGRTDGVFDVSTAAATRRAKYWLGFPEDRIDEVADLQLRRILAEEAALPAAWLEERDRRLARLDGVMVWDAALRVAREQIGRRERVDGFKALPYTLWYGVLCPWSVVFAAFCYAQAGSQAFAPGRRYAYAPYMLDDARRGHNHLSVTAEPLSGDLALLDDDHDGDPDRVALFDGWTQQQAQERFDAIEGDVGEEGQVHLTGSVARTTRTALDVVAFVHVRA
jgi:hypothetical protein